MVPFVAVTAAAWGYTYLGAKYNVGAAAYRTVHALDKYRQAIVDAIGEKINEKFKYVTVTREPTTDGKIVFNFDKVHTVDFEEMDKQIVESMKQGVAAKPGEKAKIENIENIISAGEYKVRLVITDPDVRLGDIDFADWENPNSGFEVTITKTEGARDIPITKEDAEYGEVIETLKKFAKVSTRDTFLPNESATKFPENTTRNWIWSWFGGENVTSTINLLGGLNNHLLTPEYISSLQQRAMDKATAKDVTKRDKSLLPNYFGVLEHAKKNELLHTAQLRKKMEIERAELLMSKSSRKFWLITGLAVALTIATIALVIVFAPGVAVFLAPIVATTATAIVTFVATKLFSIPGGILGAGILAAATVGWFKTRPQWNKEKVNVLERELKECKEKETALRSDLENIHNNKFSAEKTLDAIVELYDSKGNTLDLSCKTIGAASKSFVMGTLGKISKLFRGAGKDKIDDMAVNTICLHLCAEGDKAVLTTCRNLNLANNSITNEGAIILAETLTHAQTSPGFNIQRIDLTGNPIETEGLIKLQEAMMNNFTIVDLKYDLPPGTLPSFKNDIDKQQLINRRLQGVELGVPNERLIELFGGLEQFNQAILDKVKRNPFITAIPGPEPKAEVTPEVAKILAQNQIFVTLAKTPTFEGYLKAVEIDAVRCHEFMTVNEPLNREMVSKIRAVISQKLLEFSGMDCAPTLKAMFPEPRKLDTTANIELFAQVMAKMPKDQSGTVSKGMQAYVQNMFASLTSSKSDAFRASLEANRLTIAKDPTIIDEAQRRTMLNILDSALHPKLGEIDSEKFKIYQLQRLVTDQPAPAAAFAEFMKIFNEVGKEKFMLAISAEDSLLDEKTRKNLELLINITGKLPDWQNPSILDTLQKAFNHASTQDVDSFNIRLEKKRGDIARAVMSEIERKACLDALDTALHSDYDQPTLTAYQLKKLTTEHPATDLEKTFEVFINAYKDVPPDQIATALPAENLEEFINLVRADIYDGKATLFTQLRRPDLSKQHKQALLELCFKDTNDPNYTDKATLLAEILSNKEASELFLDDDSMKDFRENYLSWAFTWPARAPGGFLQGLLGDRRSWTNKELRTALEAKRKEIAEKLEYADKKIAMLTIIDSALYPGFKGNPEQFRLYQLGKLIDEHPTTDLDKTFAEFIDICKNIPANKIAAIAPKNLDKLLELIRADVYDETKSRTLFTQLRKSDLNREQKLELFKLCFKNSGDPDYEAKATFFANILSDDKAASLFLDNGIMENFREQYLAWGFTWPGHLWGKRESRTFDAMKTELENIRKKIAEHTDLTPKDKRDMLNIVDSELNPRLGTPDLAPFKIYQLQKLVAEHPASDDLKATKNPTATFTEFMSIYDKIKEEKLDTLYTIPPLNAAAAENLKIFIAMVQKLPEPRAEIALDILQENLKLLNQEPAKFKAGLDKKRGEIAASKIDSTQKRELLTIIDLSLDSLDKKLGDKDSVTLKKYQLQKMLGGQRPADKRDAFKEFMEIYEEIPQEALGEFFTDINMDELIALVKNDVYNSDHQTVCALLRTMKEPHRLALLKACFSNLKNYPEEATFEDKAALVSGIIASGGDFAYAKADRSSTTIESILYYSFYPGTVTNPYNYSELKQQLEIIRKASKAAGADEKTEILDKILQEDLIARFGCLNNTGDDFEDLKQELDQNYDLTKFTFSPEEIPTEGVKIYIESICHRNLALLALEKKDLDTFIKEYAAIDARYLTDNAFTDVFSEAEPPILEIMEPNLGESKKVGWGVRGSTRDSYKTTLNCSKLMELDGPHRIALLTQCFAPTETEENASKKAILVSNKLELLLKTIDYASYAEDKLIKDIAYEIFWALSPQKNFNLATLQKGLKEIADNIDKDNYSDTPEQLRETIRKALTPESGMVLMMGAALMEEPAPVKSAPIPKVAAKNVELALHSALLPPAKAPEVVEHLANTPTDTKS